MRAVQGLQGHAGTLTAKCFGGRETVEYHRREPLERAGLTEGEPMRILLATMLAALLVASAADAASPKKKKKAYTGQSQSQASKKSDRSLSEFSRPEDLPFGSSVWWRAMDRENRGGFAPDS